MNSPRGRVSQGAPPRIKVLALRSKTGLVLFTALCKARYLGQRRCAISFC